MITLRGKLSQAVIFKSLFLAMLPLLTTACSSEENNEDPYKKKNDNANSTQICRFADRLEFPKLSNNGHSVVIVHTTPDSYDAQGVNFSTEWDYQLGSQRWSCYQMHNGYRVSGVLRRENRIDKNTERTYPWDADLDQKFYTQVDNFVRSGFDHGHICPSADRLYSDLANDQTFYMTNMQPQYNSFNAGLWEKLESQLRTWTGTETIYVCKGATIDSEENIIKRINGVLIAPKYFFCALLKQDDSGYKAIAFWMLNEQVDRKGDALGLYALSVDELEQKTGIDFFCNLPDDKENSCEASYDLAAWGLK